MAAKLWATYSPRSKMYFARKLSFVQEVEIKSSMQGLT
jgi:hypothetical protein